MKRTMAFFGVVLALGMAACSKDETVSFNTVEEQRAQGRANAGATAADLNEVPFPLPKVVGAK